MYIPETITALLLLTAAMIWLRLMWPRISPRTRKLLLNVSIVLVVIHLFEIASKWETSSDRLNMISNWAFIAGYELIILLLTRLRPYWLTTLSAVILIVPIFAASILMPLAPLFLPSYPHMIPIGEHLSYQLNPWTNSGAGIAGGDLQIYYRPRLAPFLRHRFLVTPFNELQCNFKSAFAVLGPAPGTVLARCPHWPTQPPGFIEEALPFSQSPSRLTRVP